MQMGQADDDFAERLAALDESLAEGTAVADTQALRDDHRLAAAGQVLRRLESIWPRAASTKGPELPAGFDRFHLIRILGTGGFGIVYLADDTRLGRQVALKLPRPETLMTTSVRERFLREAHATAQLQHPNIVPIFDSGEIGVWCFLVSAYCSGGSLADWLKTQQTPMSCRTTAHLSAVLADAVQHAHQRGILHRDLKPANILLISTADGPPDFPFTLHVGDFGLAKAIQGADAVGDLTITGSTMVLGTPAYMAPEQARGGETVSPATDVYALGTLLYELLTGQSPFRGASNLETLRRVVDEEPLPPRQNRPDVPRDLEAICLKCLEKYPAHRYTDAAQLADDLRRYLDGQPTVARPLGIAWRAAKSVRRHPALAGLVAAVALGLLLTIGMFLWRNHELTTHNKELEAAVEREKTHSSQMEASAEREKKLAKKAREALELAEERTHRAGLQAYAANLVVIDGFIKKNRIDLAGDLLRRQKPLQGQEDFRDFTWRYLWQHLNREVLSLTRIPQDRTVTSLAFSPDGQHLFSGDRGAWLHRHETATGRLLDSRQVPMDPPDPGYFRFALRGDRVLAAGLLNKRAQFHVFDTWGKRILHHSTSDENYSAASISPDGQKLALRDPESDGARNVVEIAIASGKKTTLLRKDGYRGICAAYSPDGRFLAASFNLDAAPPGTRECVMGIHDFATGKQTWAPFPKDIATPSLLLWSPDGQTLVSAFLTTPVLLWNTKPLAFRQELPLQARPWHGAAFSPDSQQVALVDSSSTSGGRKVRIFRVRDGAETGSVFDSTEKVHALAWSPRDNLLAIAGEEAKIHLWNPLAASADRILPGHQGSEAWASPSPLTVRPLLPSATTTPCDSGTLMPPTDSGTRPGIPRWQAVSLIPRMVNGLQPAVMTTRSSSERRSSRTRNCIASSTPITCGAWRFLVIANSSPAPAAILWCAFGIPPRARTSAFCPDT